MLTPGAPGARRAALTLVAALVSLALAEGALLLVGLAPARYASPHGVEAPNKRRALDLFPTDPDGAFPLDLRDPETRRRWIARIPSLAGRWESTPFAVPSRYSEELCRGPDIPPRGARPRVVLVGDSFTEGLGVVEPETFAGVLSRRRPDLEVINCGRRSFDFPRLRSRFELALSLAPDVIVYAMVLNDPVRSAAFARQRPRMRSWLRRQSAARATDAGRPAPAWPPWLFALLRERLEGAPIEARTPAWYRDMVGAPNREGWKETLRSIAAVDARARERGVRLVVVLWPLLSALDEGYPFTESHRVIGRALRDRGVEIHDALGGFVGETASTLWVHPADHHPNARAHALFAEQVLTALD